MKFGNRSRNVLNANLTLTDLNRDSLPPCKESCMDLAQENGASTWLTTLPIQEYGFNLHKGAFLVQYNWQPARAPCTCGMKFSADHALSCPRADFHQLGSVT